MKIKIGIVLAIVVVAFATVYLYQKNKKTTKQPEAKLSSKVLFSAYSSVEEDANLQLLNKFIEVDGKIVSIDKNQSGNTYIVLESNDVFNGVMCTLEAGATTDSKIGDYIVVRGYCSGFAGDVKLTDCVVMR